MPAGPETPCWFGCPAEKAIYSGVYYGCLVYFRSPLVAPWLETWLLLLIDFTFVAFLLWVR